MDNFLLSNCIKENDLVAGDKMIKVLGNPIPESVVVDARSFIRLNMDGADFFYEDPISGEYDMMYLTRGSLTHIRDFVNEHIGPEPRNKP